MNSRAKKSSQKQNPIGVFFMVAVMTIFLIKEAIHRLVTEYNKLPTIEKVGIWVTLLLVCIGTVCGVVIVKRQSDKRRQNLLQLKIARNATLSRLLSMTPTQFEHYIADVFRLQGYEATVTKQTGDGGKDIILKKNGVTTLVECKLYTTTKVGRRDIQIFHSAIIDTGAEEGFIITTGSFAKTAVNYVKDKPIKLINSEDLIGMLIILTDVQHLDVRN